MMRLALNGAGRMAAAVAAAAAAHAEIHIVAAVAPGDRDRNLGVPCVVSFDAVPGQVDAVIDFSLPPGTISAARWCGAARIPLVSGVTGLDHAAFEALDSAARSCPVLWSANMSFGVNLLADLCGRAATALPASTPVQIADEHHQWKKDAPSGTALMLGAAIEKQRRENAGEVRYSSVREGEVIGRHTVTFDLGDEIVSLHHDARTRGVFASGALLAAGWLVGQPPGRYSAADWIGAVASPDARAGSK